MTHAFENFIWSLDITCYRKYILFFILFFPRAIAESIALQSGNPADSNSVQIPEYTEQQEHIDNSCPDVDEQLRLALVLSQQEVQDLERRQKQEEEELEMILKLSLTDK